MDYKCWERQLSASKLVDECLWELQIYRLAKFAAYLAKGDVKQIPQDETMTNIPRRLEKAVCAIHESVEIGYLAKKESAQYTAYAAALHTAREGRDWYYKSRYILGEQVTSHRLKLLFQIILILHTMVPVRDDIPPTIRGDAHQFIPPHLLTDVPLSEKS